MPARAKRAAGRRMPSCANKSTVFRRIRETSTRNSPARCAGLPHAACFPIPPGKAPRAADNAFARSPHRTRSPPVAQLLGVGGVTAACRQAFPTRPPRSLCTAGRLVSRSIQHSKSARCKKRAWHPRARPACPEKKAEKKDSPPFSPPKFIGGGRAGNHHAANPTEPVAAACYPVETARKPPEKQQITRACWGRQRRAAGRHPSGSR